MAPSYESNDLSEHYKSALNFTKSHYENFPVISLFVKKDLKKHVAAIYQFARQADDIADEGNLSGDERINRLNEYQKAFMEMFKHQPINSFWKILKVTIQTKNLSTSHFLDLLKAFKQDIIKSRYSNFDEILEYCKNSANPVGRLILELNGIQTNAAYSYSDKICTALQLANFYQDVNVDIQKDRIYIPQDEMNIFEISEEDIKSKVYTEKFAKLMKYQVERTKRIFLEGREILKYLPFRLRFQILVTIKGGETILKKIEEINFNVVNNRPTLSKFDVVKLFLSAIILGR